MNGHCIDCLDTDIVLTILLRKLIQSVDCRQRTGVVALRVIPNIHEKLVKILCTFRLGPYLPHDFI